MVTPSILVFHAPLTANSSPHVKWTDRTLIPEALTKDHPAGQHHYVVVLVIVPQRQLTHLMPRQLASTRVRWQKTGKDHDQKTVRDEATCQSPLRFSEVAKKNDNRE